MEWYSDCKRVSELEVKQVNVLAKYRHTGTTDRQKGSGRPVTIADENLAEVKQLCQLQDNKSGTEDPFSTFSVDQLTD